MGCTGLLALDYSARTVTGLQTRIALAIVLVLAILVVLTNQGPHHAHTYAVRAVFDDAAFAVPGEDVRVAGAPVGSISSLEVCTKTPCPASSPLNKAAVTIQINNVSFTPFFANAHCAIRPQSLIGEKYVDCEPGSRSSPTLHKITSGPGSGTYLLPLANTSSPIDSDIVQDISQQPVRQRFALILDELGTGLAARGSDLNNVVHRANPALGQTDKVLQILARQNHVLARLSSESDAVLAPLARAGASSRTSSCRRTRPRWRARPEPPTSPARSSCFPRSFVSSARSSPSSASSPTRARR